MSANEDQAKKDLKEKKRVGLVDPALPVSSPRSVVSVVADTDEDTSQSSSLYIGEPSEKQMREELVLSGGFNPVQLQDDVPQKLQLTPQIESKLKAHIPPGYQLKFTTNNSDSWWEATAQGLNQLIGNDKVFSVKTLRLLVNDIVKTKRPDWLTPELLLSEHEVDENFYLARISETVVQMKENNERKTLEGEAISGSNIEARILCTQFPINIHWIDIDEDGEISERLTTSDGTEDIKLSNNDYANRHNMLHLVTYNGHIVPIINYKNKPTLDPHLLSSILDLGRSPKIPLDRSRRLSGNTSKSKAVRVVEEIFSTEKIYHERLKQFALPRVPGKKAKPKKSIWQKFLILIGWHPNEEHDTNQHVLNTIWPEIKKIAIDQHLDVLAENLEEFVSNYTNPENDEKEIIYSTDTVDKAKRSWDKIKRKLLEQYLLTHYQSCEFDKMADKSFIGKLPSALEILNTFLKKSDLTPSDIANKRSEIIKKCLINNLPSDWAELKKFLQDNNLYNNAIREQFEPFVNKLLDFHTFIATSTSNSLPGGWERLKQVLIDNKEYSGEFEILFNHLISKYTALAQSPHAFSKIDALEDDEEYQHLVTQGITDENLCDWIDIIYDAVIGKQREFTITDPKTYEAKKVIRQGSSLEPVYKNMAVISVYYDHIARTRDAIAKKLKEYQHKISDEDIAYIKKAFNSGVEEYFQKTLILVVQRIALYKLFIKDLQSKLNYPEHHKVYQHLREIHDRLDQLGRMANEVPKLFPKFEDKTNPENYRVDRPYSGYSLGNNYAAISYMAKLGRLINCWQNNALGREVLLPRIEKLDEQYKNAETEHHAAKVANDKIKKDKKASNAERRLAQERVNQALRNFETAKEESFAFKSLRVKIWERKYLEDQYVNEFQNHLQRLFIDSRQYFNNPITSKIDEIIDDIVQKIGDPQSIFVNTLIMIRRNFRGEPQPHGHATPHFPLDIFDDCFISNIQSLRVPALLPNEKNKEQSPPSIGQTQSSPANEGQITSTSKLSIEEEMNAKQAQHYMRLTIIDRVKVIFQKFDQQTQQRLLKPASDSIQKVSYRIQQDLDELTKTSLKDYETNYSARPDKEIIGDVIIKRIRPYLECAGILQESFLTGEFGTTLNEAADYLNQINQSKKSPIGMFVHNFLPVRDVNQQTTTFCDQRPTKIKLCSLVWNLLAITDFYCRTGLGLLIAQRAGVEPNNKLRHADIMQKLAGLTKRFALHENIYEEMSEDQANLLLQRLLAILKTEIIDPFPDHDSRSINELIHLYNHFITGTQIKAIEPRDKRRFENYKMIVNYQVAKEDAEIYFHKHITQKYARAVLDYSHEIYGRYFVETAVCKEEAHNAILNIINEIYEMPAKICKIKINELPLPASQRNISSLIHYRIHEYVKKALSSKLIYQQGQFGKMLQKIDAIHEQMNPGASIPHIPATGSLTNLFEDHHPITARVAPSANRSLTGSMTEQNFNAHKSPAKTPSKTPRRNTALSQYGASHNNRANELPAKKLLISLVSQVLALSHYYRNTEIGEEICSKLQIPANENQQGQNEVATELANFALELFLEDEADNQQVLDQNSRNIELYLRQRNLRAQERLNRLVDKMAADINKIRGDGSLVQNITHSPDSRFAKAVEELLPVDRQKGKKRNILNPLQFTTAKNTEFLSKITTPKQFIHHVVIEQSYRQFEKLEENLMGSIKKKAGDPQQIAANQIHQELKKLAVLPLSSCESEITKLGQGKNIRDLVFSKVSDAIVRSGKIAECIFDGPLGGKLLKVANLLFNTQQSDTHSRFLQKIFTPNQVRRYPKVSQEQPSIERTKLHVCGRLFMLSDYYLDTPLGRQVADKGAGEGTASYNVSKKGWAADAEKIRAIATGLYFGKYSSEEAKSAIRDVLNHIKLIIHQIRSSGSSGLHSRFVNELIRIVKDYGNEHDLKIATNEEIDEHYLFNNAAQMFDSRIGTDNFEDYSHMSVMQNYVAAELVKLKNEINSQRWTCVADKESLEIAEKNLDDLFKKGLKERRALIQALPHGQQDICYLIRERLQNRIPYPFWSMNPQGGQIQKAIQRIKQNLNDIKQPQTSPIVSSMRIPSRV